MPVTPQDALQRIDSLYGCILSLEGEKKTCSYEN
jgi:hypothetical protein